MTTLSKGFQYNARMRHASKKSVRVIDLFCGVGGMTHGFVNEGFQVLAGIDNDATCEFGYTRNNKAAFICKDIAVVQPEELQAIYGDCDVRVLIGCAPCQPFSHLNNKEIMDEKLVPLECFAKLIESLKPEIVSMENVKGLLDKGGDTIFKKFLNTLEANSYSVSYKIVDTSEYGVPQRRMRLVLLASRLGQIELISPTHQDKKKTVRDAIGHLEPLEDGETSLKDELHRARKLSPLNKRRIRSTPKDGGNSSSWSEDLKLACHKKPGGMTFKSSVYGRMRWDQPAPTMTTQCTGIGNGRFGHPQQDRAISLREAALIQTFPTNYKFIAPGKPLVTSVVSRQIGNAVPVRLGQVIAMSIKQHLKQFA